MVAHLEDTGILNDGQHGFRKGRSCHSQLLAHYDKILQDTQVGENVDVIYLNFAKVFDKVDHGILLHKIKALGISRELGKWLHSFLSNRKQRVNIKRTLSEESMVISGIPQGSVLGPLLFLIMIGGIDRGIQLSTVTTFADDTRIAKKIWSVEDVRLLQDDLDTILRWARDNMTLNAEKFELLRYGNLNGLKGQTSYNCEGRELAARDVVKDLGVHMCQDATFSHHIKHATAAARQLAGWILRTFQTRIERCMLTLWKVLVLPRLEYSCQLWSPQKLSEISEVEASQKTFTSKIQWVQHLNYWERFRKLRLYSLQRVNYVWKILEHRVPNVGIVATQHPRRGRLCYVRTTSGSSQRIRSIIHHGFTYSGTRVFNCISTTLRNMKGVCTDTFKTHLHKWLATIPDEPPTPGYPRQNSNRLVEWTMEEWVSPDHSGVPAQLHH